MRGIIYYILELNHHDQKIRQPPRVAYGTLDSCFDLIWISSAVYTVISPTRDQTPDQQLAKPRLLLLGHGITSHMKLAKLTTHGEMHDNLTLCVLMVHRIPYQRTRPPPCITTSRHEVTHPRIRTHIRLVYISNFCERNYILFITNNIVLPGIRLPDYCK